MSINSLYKRFIYEIAGKDNLKRDFKYIDKILSMDSARFNGIEADYSSIETGLFNRLEEQSPQDELKMVYHYHKMIAGFAIILIYLYLFI